MTKYSGFLKKCLHEMLLIFMGIQIVLGIVYMTGNFTAIQNFTETTELLEVSRTYLLDEYMGILYPLLLAFGQWAAGITTIPFCAFIYGIQLLASIGAGLFLTDAFYACNSKKNDGSAKTGNSGEYHISEHVNETCRKKCLWRRLFPAAFLTTIPMVMQMHMAVLPFSLALSCFEVILGLIILLVRNVTSDAQNGQKRAMRCYAQRMIMIGVMYVISSLLIVDTFWILAIVLCITFIILALQHTEKRKLLLGAVTLLVSMALVTGINAVTVTKGSRGRIQNSFGAAMVNRFVWPNFATNYYFWSDEVKEVLTLEDAVRVCQREDAVSNYFGPMIEGAYGRVNANRIYLEMAARCLMDRTKEIVFEIGDDLLDYSFIPWSVQQNLQGVGTSQTAWNYGRMTEHTPILSKVYFRYGLLEASLLLLCTIINFLIGCKESGRSSRISNALILIITGFVFAAWYTMRSNSPIDYKLVLPVIILWYLPAVQSLEKVWFDKWEKR